MPDFDDQRIREAVARTEVIRAPKQNLFTFGTTSIYYYLVTEPAATPLPREADETVVREGRVIAQKPQIVTPYYLTSLEGFGENARRYFDFLVQKYGRDAPGLFYAYRNEPKETNIIGSNLLTVIEKIKADLEQRGDPLTALIKGVDELWDVALVRFIFELTSRSVGDHISQMNERGLLNADSRGVPAGARARIEEMFRQVARGERDPKELKKELDGWGLFPEYQDRFFSLFRK